MAKLKRRPKPGKKPAKNFAGRGAEIAMDTYWPMLLDCLNRNGYRAAWKRLRVWERSVGENVFLPNWSADAKKAFVETLRAALRAYRKRAGIPRRRPAKKKK